MTHPADLVQRGATVRIFSAGDQNHHILAEGRIIGFQDRPKLILQHPDGSQSSWSVDLPQEETESKPCPRCDGCGQLADTPEAEPWTAWTALPVRSAAAVTLGVVRPVTCDAC